MVIGSNSGKYKVAQSILFRTSCSKHKNISFSLTSNGFKSKYRELVSYQNVILESSTLMMSLEIMNRNESGRFSAIKPLERF